MSGAGIGFWWDEFQQVFDFAIQNSTNSGQNIDIQPGNVVVTVVVDLGALHFCTVAELVFADAGLFDQRIQFDVNGSVFLHGTASCVEKCRKNPVDISSLYKLDWKYKL